MNETFDHFRCSTLIPRQDRPHKVYIFLKLGAICIHYRVYHDQLLNCSSKTAWKSDLESFSRRRYPLSLTISNYLYIVITVNFLGQLFKMSLHSDGQCLNMAISIYGTLSLTFLKVFSCLFHFQCIYYYQSQCRGD